MTGIYRAAGQHHPRLLPAPPPALCCQAHTPAPTPSMYSIDWLEAHASKDSQSALIAGQTRFTLTFGTRIIDPYFRPVAVAMYVSFTYPVVRTTVLITNIDIGGYQQEWLDKDYPHCGTQFIDSSMWDPGDPHDPIGRPISARPVMWGTYTSPAFGCPLAISVFNHHAHGEVIRVKVDVYGEMSRRFDGYQLGMPPERGPLPQAKEMHASLAMGAERCSAATTANEPVAELPATDEPVEMKVEEIVAKPREEGFAKWKALQLAAQELRRIGKVIP